MTRTRRKRIKAKRDKLRKERKGEPLWELVEQNGVMVARRPKEPEEKQRYLLPGD